MLTVTFPVMDWLTVEVRSQTHEFAFDGRSLSNFSYEKRNKT
ncbi:hypothetical protein ACSVDE_03775 [Pseudalkalibacillus sp. Hm43]